MDSDEFLTTSTLTLFSTTSSSLSELIFISFFTFSAFLIGLLFLFYNVFFFFKTIGSGYSVGTYFDVFVLTSALSYSGIFLFSSFSKDESEHLVFFVYLSMCFNKTRELFIVNPLLSSESFSNSSCAEKSDV